MAQDGLGLQTTNYVVQGTPFEVESRYRITNPLSHDAYGVVCLADDYGPPEEGQAEPVEKVTVKKVESIFEHITVAKRTLRELRILRQLQHENVLQVKKIFMTKACGEFQEIYVISEHMETDMATTLKSSQELSEEHCQFFCYQILRGMKYVHSAQVIHRDLKPRSLLVNSNCDLKICDFGLARVRFSDKDWVCPMTEYVCTRWYRAPEVLCSWTDYSTAIDIWSIACILVEMHTRKPLFPGNNTQHQLDLIMNLMGTPVDEELMKIPNDKCRRFIQACPRTPGKSFEAAFPGMSEEVIELLSKMLSWDPAGRLSVEEALNERFFASLVCPEDEPTREPLDTGLFEFERRRITSLALRQEIFRECLCYYPEKLASFQEAVGGASELSRCRLLVPGEAQLSSDEEED